ncbi:MAG: L-threonylcarbamoyladenylate synthase [Dictyoglomus sp.]|nr:L-threonylcarbamoyladenylate synthase [Dictyoglomus sp.]MCX7942825.1 L-threonylcarbamoyladenylate synthase [Dictyoglomaceae bacterium]MDW8188367.1 L-threonylcarbamoyladenylate synthase [Dictyoglomus sp.]
MSKYLKIDPNNISREDLDYAVKILEEGGLVAFPTETVYGLGADAFNPLAIKKIFIAKERPLDNPIIVHVGKIEEVYSLAEYIPHEAEKLIKNFWPGPLTLILPRSSLVNDLITAGSDKVAIRQPSHPVALALLRAFGRPICAPSANLSGRPSPTKAEHVIKDLGNRIDLILDGGEVTWGVESTVLDLTSETPTIFRPGACPKEDIERILGKKVEIWKGKGKNVPSPGLKHKHYAPKVPLYIIENFNDEWKNRINKFIEEGKRVGVLASEEYRSFYPDSVKLVIVGTRKNLATIASNLFGAMRYLEEEVDIILSEAYPLEGLGLAIMDRLRRASYENSNWL